MVYFNQAKATDALLAGEKEEEQARSFPQNYATLLKIYIRVNVKGLMKFNFLLITLVGSFISIALVTSYYRNYPPSPSARVRWKAEELNQLNFNWSGAEISKSLKDNLLLLSPSDRKNYDLLFSKRANDLGQAIGLGKAFGKISTLNFQEADSRAALLPLEDFTLGDRRKHEELVLERKGDDTMCHKSTWQEGYRETHRAMMQGRKNARLLEYYCQDYSCGGLSDRLLGVVGVFLYSVLSNRAVSIRWDNPVPFDLLFDSPNVDWSQPMTVEDELSHPIYGNRTLIATRHDVNVSNYGAHEADAFFAWFDWNSVSLLWERFIFNRGVVFRSFGFDRVRPRLEELGFEYNTAFSCLFRYLLRPKPIVMQHIAAYTSYVSQPSVYSIGIQVRTGDASMKSKEYDQINTVERHKEYFNCAEQIASKFAMPDQRVVFYLISDSNHLKADASLIYGDRLITSGFVAQHAEDSTKGANYLTSVLTLYDVIAEMWTFAATDFHILTKSSGFGKIATWLRAKPDKTIAIFARWNENVNVGHADIGPHLDCSSDDALISFAALANEWSLG